MKSVLLAAFLFVPLSTNSQTACAPVTVHTGLGLTLADPNSFVVETDGTIVAADGRNNRVVRISATGAQTVVAGSGAFGFTGDGGPATAASLSSPDSVYAAESGELFIADTSNARIRKVDRSGVITTIAGGSGQPFEGINPQPRDPLSVPIILPRQVQVDRKGNVYFIANHQSAPHVFVLDKTTGLLRLFEPALPRSVAAQPFFPTAFTIDSVDRVVVAGARDPGAAYELRYPGWETPPPSYSGLISRVNSMAYDRAGNLYLSEFGRLRRLTPDGHLYTLAGRVSGEFAPPEKLVNLSSAQFSIAVGSKGVYIGTATDVRRFDTASCSATMQPIIGQLPGSIANAAGAHRPGLVAGELISIYGVGLGPEGGLAAQLQSGVLPSELAGTRVLLDGTRLPLLYASAGQVNTIVPFALAQRPCLTLEYRGIASDTHCFLRTYAADPGIFKYSGQDRAILLNQDRTINSETNPAAVGSVVTLWGTGFGSLTPTLRDGTIAGDVLSRVDIPITARVNGLAAEIDYAGSAPGMVAGVVQFNIRLPRIQLPGTTVAIIELSAGEDPGTATFWVR